MRDTDIIPQMVVFTSGKRNEKKWRLLSFRVHSIVIDLIGNL